MSAPAHGLRAELTRAAASGRLTVILVSLGLLAGLVGGILVNRQSVTVAQRDATAAQRQAADVKRAVDAELDARSQQRDSAECALLDTFTVGPLTADQRARVLSLRGALTARAVPPSACLIPVPAPGPVVPLPMRQ